MHVEFTPAAIAALQHITHDEAVQAAEWLAEAVRTAFLSQYGGEDDWPTTHAWAEVEAMAPATYDEEWNDPIRQAIANGYPGEGDGPAQGAEGGVYIAAAARWLCFNVVGDDDAGTTPIYKKAPNAPRDAGTYQLWI